MIDKLKIENTEERIHAMPDSQDKQCMLELLNMLQFALHQLDDPRYMFAGGRVTRSAILCRNAEISELRFKLTNFTHDFVKRTKGFTDGLTRAWRKQSVELLNTPSETYDGANALEQCAKQLDELAKSL